MIYGVTWLIFSRETLEWHSVATLATWLMTLFIQRAEHRDTQAIHAKLDELLHVHGDARHDLTQLDEKEPEQIQGRSHRYRPVSGLIERRVGSQSTPIGCHNTEVNALLSLTGVSPHVT